MFEEVFENLRQASETTVKAQEEFFQKWTTLWATVPSSPSVWGESVQKLHKKGQQLAGDILKKQRAVLEGQFQAGLRQIEEAFRLGQAKDPEEFRVKTLELWSKTFDHLRHSAEAQLQEFQAAMEKWSEFVTKHAA